MLISSIIIFNTFIIAYSAKTYDCRNGTVYLEVNELAFFETTNFPVLLSKEEKEQCDLMFMLSNNTTVETQMVVVFFQFGYDDPVPKDFPTHFSISGNISYTIQEGFFQVKLAEQGFLAFIDNFDYCPLEFLCKDKPFEILHETQIIHIRSTYVNNQIRKVPCLWEFISPNGYGFKIVIQKFNISRTASLKIQNTTDVIANERSLKTNYPHYNGDNYIQITLTIGDPTFITEMEFQAYISIVKNLPEKTNKSCSVSVVDSTIFWSSNDYKIKGYENNIQCFYELVVPPKHVAIATMYGYTEDFVDYFLYHENGSNISKRIDEFINGFTEIAIDNFKGDVEKRVIFEFVSDGSVQSFGFQIVFEFTNCECVKVVKCGDESFLLPNQYYYCGNIKCNITIGRCPDAFTYVQFDSYTNVSANDIFRIISNNRIVFEITDWIHDNHFTYLNSSVENIFQVITADSTKFHVLSIEIGGYEANKLKIIFTEDDMTAVIDTQNIGLLIVETELENQYFTIFCQHPKSLALYTDTSLTTLIKYCFIGDHPNTCIIKKNNFVIMSGLVSTYLTIRSSKSKNNCVFKESTYFTNSLPNFTISALSNSNGPCLIILLLDDDDYSYSGTLNPPLSVTQLWTTSKKQNVQFFVGIDQTAMFFEFNYNTRNTWKNILLDSAIYTIMIPPGSAIFIRLERISLLVPTGIQFNIEENGYKSLLTTPDYACTKRFQHTYKKGEPSAYHPGCFRYSIMNYPILFSVINAELIDESFSFTVDGDDHSVIEVKKAGESFLFQNQSVVFCYSANIFGTQGTGVLLLVQTYNETMSYI